MSNAVKIELIGSSLWAASHDVEVLSQGEIVDNKLKFYRAFSELQRFQPDIPIRYASALPIRHLNALWSSWRTVELFKSRHRAVPFDLVIIFNLKEPQVACAEYAIRRLGLPVILEYEDDRFVNVFGETRKRSLLERYRDRQVRRLLQAVSGCIAVSPHLLSQLPERLPKMLLRGVASEDIVKASKQSSGARRNWILFSGTHIESNGIGSLIEAWRLAPIAGWELHITGYGQLTDFLRRKAASVPGVTFHGLVSRQELVQLMSLASICINSQTASLTPGNVFAFKIIEYLAAGAHCITTRMGPLEPDLEAGISYMPDNSPETIADTLRRVVNSREYERRAAGAAVAAYGLPAVTRCLDKFVRQVRERPGKGAWAAPESVANLATQALPNRGLD